MSRRGERDQQPAGGGVSLSPTAPTPGNRPAGAQHSAELGFL